MNKDYMVHTPPKGFTDVTALVHEAIKESCVVDGICVVYCPHTTAGVTINENADPDVVRDMLLGLDRAFPDRPEFRHAEGNSAAHLKASAVGSSVTVIVSASQPLLGTWQGVYLCEFDGPRVRHLAIKVMGEKR